MRNTIAEVFLIVMCIILLPILATLLFIRFVVSSTTAIVFGLLILAGLTYLYCKKVRKKH